MPVLHTYLLIQVGDHEVECSPSFKLYLHTSSWPQYIPCELAAYTTLVYYQNTRESAKMQLLDRLVR